MSSCEERIDGQSDPVIVNEHVVRYLFARDLIAGSNLWIDLGCGTGYGSEAALAGKTAKRTLLVDSAEQALAEVSRRFTGPSVQTHQADLSNVAQVEELIAKIVAIGVEPPTVITCFEVVEHLESYRFLIAGLKTLSEVHGFDVVLSVPNDAFFGPDNPYHLTTWSAQAVEELRQLIPREHIVAQQKLLQGSYIDLNPSQPEPQQVSFLPREDAEPSQFLLAFGPRLSELSGPTSVVPVDTLGHRAWELQREADLAYYKHRGELLFDLEIGAIGGNNDAPAEEEQPEPETSEMTLEHAQAAS